MQPQYASNNAYDQEFQGLYLAPEEYEAFNLALPDDKLRHMLITSLEENRDYWNQKPWNLENTDKDSVAYFLGEQVDESNYLVNNTTYKDNRLFTGVRAILSYATGQLAKPELTPSKSDDINIKAARDLQMALYQHSLDEKVDRKVRAAATNLVVRKRAFLKLRFDPAAGYDGDIVTEVVDPSDIIIDRHAKYLDNPNVIYHRLRCTVDELIQRFPKKKEEILRSQGIIQQRYSQMSRYITYFEAWFTYIDGNESKEGVAWFLQDGDLILDKQPNPNWIYTGNYKKDKERNLMSCPPKPFVAFNYMNFGKSYIDETSLFEQARPQQEIVNRRGDQIMKNGDFVNGRWIASKDAFNEEDAQRLINKGPKTVAMATGQDVSKALVNVAPNEMSQFAVNTLYDARSEIDNILGTPAQFRGAQPQSQDTATRDLLVKQQAGALQDDLVVAVSDAMETYYKIKLQMMTVYYDEDHWFLCKGGDGKYVSIMLNGKNIDSNVKIGVQTDSTLPLDKQSIRATALDLWKMGQAIDYLTLMQDLGLPDPEIRTERYYRALQDPVGYLKSVELNQIDVDAEADIQLLLSKKEPEERDNYTADYLNYFNQFMASNRFARLKPDQQERLTSWLMAVQHVANNSANLQALLLDDAGMLIPPPTPQGPPMPQGASPMGAQPAEQPMGMEATPPVPTQ